MISAFRLCKTLLFTSSLFLLFSNSVAGQIEPNDSKFDFKSLTITYNALYRKLEKPEKLFTNTNNRFVYNYPAEIDNLRGGYIYRGRAYCSFAKTQPEADSFSVISDFSGLQAANFVADEAVQVAVPGTYNTTTNYFRTYNLVYPVTMHFYKKGTIIKTIEFFTPSSPLPFKLNKNQIDLNLSSLNTPFPSKEEIAGLEKAGKVNKAAERYAYFEAIRKVDEIIKSYYGTFDYDFELGSFSIRKKKASAFADLNAAVDILDDAITAFKKKNNLLRDSLANTALKQFRQLSELKEERINAVVQEMLRYNMLVCYALLGDLDKTKEMLASHRTSSLQKIYPFSSLSMDIFLNVQFMHRQLVSKEMISL